MMVLFWTVFLGVIALTFYALTISGEAQAKEKVKKGEAQDSLKVKETEIASKEQEILELQGQINVLKKELEKAQVDYKHIKEEAELTKKREADLKEELLKRQQWVKTSDEALQKIKAQSQETEKKFVIKEKALQEEFSKNVDLTRRVNDLTAKVQWLEKDVKDKSNEIEALKHQVQDRIAQAEALTQTVAQMKDEKEHSEWVPKIEFSKLNEEYTRLQEDSEKREQRIKVLSDEIIQLKKQLKEREQAAKPKPEQTKQEEKVQPQEEAPQEEKPPEIKQLPPAPSQVQEPEKSQEPPALPQQEKEPPEEGVKKEEE